MYDKCVDLLSSTSSTDCDIVGPVGSVGCENLECF